MKYNKSNNETENKSILALELTQLKPLIGRWNFKGSFKDNPDKWVKGWETYEVIDDGKAILCDGETQTILSGNVVDIYKNSMKIRFKTNEKKIIGGNEWEINFDRNTLIFQNNRHRFTGNLNESKGTITGIWENMTASGEWKYWYSKTFTKTDKIKLK
jgi:hypothetical protein